MDTYLSTHFTWTEFTQSNTATKRGIDNTVPDHIIPNLKRTAQQMEMVRQLLQDEPIHVLSGYRSLELNLAVHGAIHSDHMIGMACDFVCPGYGDCLSVARKLVKYQDALLYKQLILEHTWVHISWEPNPNTVPAMQVLSLLDGGRYSQGLTDSKGKAYV